jgi:maltose alpha-D-glucosyltransferase/alpha-amylase
LIRTRRACPEVGWGAWQVVEAGDPGVLAMRYEWRGETAIVAHNLGERRIRVKLQFEDGPARLKPLLCDSDDDRTPREAGAAIEIDPYGFRWFRGDAERR